MTATHREQIDRLVSVLRDALDPETSRTDLDAAIRSAQDLTTQLRDRLPLTDPDDDELVDRLVAASALLDQVGAADAANRLLIAARGGRGAERFANALAANHARHGDWDDVERVLIGADSAIGDVGLVNMALTSVYGTLDDTVRELAERLGTVPAHTAVERFALAAAAFEHAMTGGNIADARTALDNLDGCAADVLTELGDDDPYLDFVLLITASARSGLGAVDGDVTALRDTADVLGLAVQRMSVALGPDHVRTLGGLADLAYADFAIALAGRSADTVAPAVTVLAAVRDRVVGALGNGHRLAARTAMNAAAASVELARLNGSPDDVADAARELRRAAELAHGAFGPVHPLTAIAMANAVSAEFDLALRRHSVDDLRNLVPVLERAAPQTDSALGATHPTAVVQHRQLAACRQLIETPPTDDEGWGTGADYVTVFAATGQTARPDDSGRAAKRARQDKAWAAVEAIKDRDESVHGTVVEVVKGGLIVDIGLRAFLPASLIEMRRVGQLRSYIGRELDAKVIEMDRHRNNVVLSRRAWLEKTRHAARGEFLGQLRKGQVRTGTVSSIVNFGAFVDLGGIDGLVHLSELSWHHVDHPSEVVAVGQQVMVEVLDVDLGRERVSLSMRAAQEDPWRAFARTHQIGQILPGTITTVMPFGAFLKVADGIEGLVHISQLAEYRVEKPEDVVRVGDELLVELVDIDLSRRRISLSLKRANAVPSDLEFDPTRYGMVAEYDENGNFVYPEGFDPDTDQWLPGYETQQDEWENQYQQAEALYQQHMAQVAAAQSENARG